LLCLLGKGYSPAISRVVPLRGGLFVGRNSSLSGDRYIVADFIFTVYNGYVRKYN